jgi:LacI family transcriptional regulator
VSTSVDLIISMSSNRGEKVVRGAVNEARRRRRFRWRVLTPTVDHELRRALHESRADGLIVLRESTNAVYDELSRQDRPVVHIGRNDAGAGVSSVLLDEIAVGRMGASFFLDRGFEDLVYCGFEEDISRTRGEGFIQRAREAGVDVKVPYVKQASKTMPSWVALYHGKFLRKWLSQRRGPMGILAFNDQIGAQVLDAAQDVGLSIPQDAAVLGVDNAETRCEICEPALSSVDPGQERLGAVAVELMCELLEGKPGRSVVLPPLRVVQRESTGAFVSGDPLVAQAMLLVEEQLAAGIRVEGLGEQLEVSRSTLERSFRSALNCSPAQWIRQARIVRAKDLLTHTDDLIGQVARKCGWEHVSDFMRSFKREMSMTPSAYRQQAQQQLEGD